MKVPEHREADTGLQQEGAALRRGFNSSLLECWTIPWRCRCEMRASQEETESINMVKTERIQVRMAMYAARKRSKSAAISLPEMSKCMNDHSEPNISDPAEGRNYDSMIKD